MPSPTNTIHAVTASERASAGIHDLSMNEPIVHMPRVIIACLEPVRCRYHPPMNRRTFVRFGSMAAVGFGLEGCAPKSAPSTPPSQPRNTPRVLPLVHASWDRVIRTTIGLRPHRDSGFLLKADKLDAKTVIHNFGHGGSGMSISWGTASMAVDFVMQQPD